MSETLQETWERRISKEIAFKLRDAIENEDKEALANSFKEVVNYININFSDLVEDDYEFSSLQDDAETLGPEDDDDQFDYALDRLYDYLDSNKIWLPIQALDEQVKIKNESVEDYNETDIPDKLRDLLLGLRYQGYMWPEKINDTFTATLIHSISYGPSRSKKLEAIQSKLIKAIETAGFTDVKVKAYERRCKDASIFLTSLYNGSTERVSYSVPGDKGYLSIIECAISLSSPTQEDIKDTHTMNESVDLLENFKVSRFSIIAGDEEGQTESVYDCEYTEEAINKYNEIKDNYNICYIYDNEVGEQIEQQEIDNWMVAMEYETGSDFIELDEDLFEDIDHESYVCKIIYVTTDYKVSEEDYYDSLEADNRIEELKQLTDEELEQDDIYAYVQLEDDEVLEYYISDLADYTRVRNIIDNGFDEDEFEDDGFQDDNRLDYLRRKEEVMPLDKEERYELTFGSEDDEDLEEDFNDDIAEKSALKRIEVNEDNLNKYYYNQKGNIYYKNPDTGKYEVVDGFDTSDILNAIHNGIEFIYVDGMERNINESSEGDQIAQDYIDSKNANYEADKETTREVRKELAKQGIATNEDGEPINETINVREALNDMDKELDQPHLLNLYDAISLSVDEKKELVEMISTKKGVKQISKYLNSKYKLDEDIEEEEDIEDISHLVFDVHVGDGKFIEEFEVSSIDEIDHYFKLIKDTHEAEMFNYHSDYWGTAEDYQNQNISLIESLSPYIGKKVYIEYEDGDIKGTLLGIAIDTQYNSISHTRIILDSIEDYNF
jgi:hypothetical protein